MESFFFLFKPWICCVWISWWSSQGSWHDTSQPSRYLNGTPRKSNRQDRLCMGWIHNIRELYLLLNLVDKINVHASLLWYWLLISASRLKYLQSLYLICLPSVPRARWWLHQSLLDARLFNRLTLIPYRVRQIPWLRCYILVSASGSSALTSCLVYQLHSWFWEQYSLLQHDLSWSSDTTVSIALPSRRHKSPDPNSVTFLSC